MSGGFQAIDSGMSESQHITPMKVRDSECDAQGVVNNANYLVYLEHARHEYLEAVGQHFADLVTRNIFLMVSHMELDFLNSLKGGERFEVRSEFKRKGPKAVFHQQIVRVSDQVVCLKAKVDIICKIDGKLTRGAYFDEWKLS
ncbi:MAG: acyl-CoA thioesterase [Asticcacaulis sp.]